MNILFLSISKIKLDGSSGIYGDLLRTFAQHGHNVYVVRAAQRREREKTHLENECGCSMLKVKTLNLTKTNVLEKGIATVMVEPLFIKAIKKYYKDVKFDLVLYATPPVTFAKVVKYVKKRDGAKSYLLLKDIFPQNAVDIGMLRKTGLKGVLYRFFRKKEQKLYALSDTIGCMSEANCQYVLKHNPTILAEQVEVCPNSIIYQESHIEPSARQAIREKYGIPLDKKVFVYGGNLGKPQGIDFLISCLEQEKTNPDAYFLIVGDGTEFSKLNAYLVGSNPQNAKLLKRLPKEDYDTLIKACDVGMIFLDHRFTIPNFPSRLLSYMQTGMPVLACTDPNTDIGKVIAEGKFGWWCESNDAAAFSDLVKQAVQADCKQMGEQARTYLLEHYTCEQGYQTIMRRIEK